MLFQVVPPSVEYCQALVPTTSPFSSVIDVAVIAIPCTAFKSTSLCAKPKQRGDRVARVVQVVFGDRRERLRLRVVQHRRVVDVGHGDRA